MKDKKKIKDHILSLAVSFEVVLAIVILLVVVLGTFDTLRVIYSTYVIDFNHPVDYSQLNSIFAHILLLVIGVEIAIMLTLHKQSALLEVLMYGIARKMLLLPKSEGMLEIFLGVVAIGGLFLIRKYHIADENSSKELGDDASCAENFGESKFSKIKK